MADVMHAIANIFARPEVLLGFNDPEEDKDKAPNEGERQLDDSDMEGFEFNNDDEREISKGPALGDTENNVAGTPDLDAPQIDKMGLEINFDNLGAGLVSE